MKAAERAIQAALLRAWQPGDILDRLSQAAGGDVTDVLDASGRFDLEAARTLRIVKKLKFRSRTGRT